MPACHRILSHPGLDQPFDVAYNGHQWTIVNTIPAGAAFSVVRDEYATTLCNADYIFVDGSDGN